MIQSKRKTSLPQVAPADLKSPGGEVASEASAQPLVNRASQPRRPLRSLLWGAVFGATAAVSATLGAALVILHPTDTTDAAQPGVRQIVGNLLSNSFGYRVTRPVNILVMGIDHHLDTQGREIATPFSGRSDVMMLVRVDPVESTASILSIPRDTRVEIPGYGVSKINHANLEGGAALAAQTVSYSLDSVPVDRYLRISTGAFRELVDLLGGVEIYVPKRMQYEDVTQKLKIDLEPGWQVLNGSQAEQFARFRRDGLGDIGRVQRQQQLLAALKNRLTNPAVLPKLPQIIKLMQTYIDTNLTLEEMLALMNFGLQLPPEQLHMVLLPGRFSRPDESIASYWIMDDAGRDRVMRDHFRVNTVASVSEPVALTQLRIAVQNATDDPRLERQVIQHLQEQGFTNLYRISDYPDWQQETQIIVQRGDLQGAAAVESALGTGQIVSASTGDLDSDITIRIGTDWRDRLENTSY